MSVAKKLVLFGDFLRCLSYWIAILVACLPHVSKCNSSHHLNDDLGNNKQGMTISVENFKSKRVTNNFSSKKVCAFFEGSKTEMRNIRAFFICVSKGQDKGLG